jgi:hypothetical protein
MATNTEIPVTFTPEATERIAELGLQAEVQQMIEHTKEVIPDAVAINVEDWYDYDSGGPPNLTVVAWRPGVSQSLEDYAAQDEWSLWLIRQFPASVSRWITFDLLFQDEHGR